MRFRALTLVLVPVVYTLTEDAVRRLGRVGAWLTRPFGRRPAPRELPAPVSGDGAAVGAPQREPLLAGAEVDGRT